MIHETLEKVLTSFKSEIEDTCLCSLKTIRFDKGNTPDYTKREIQHLYILRYYPAYLCEYKYLYKKVITDKNIDSLSILSVGCGSCVDYHGAFLANKRNNSNISYDGIDLVRWDCADSLGNPKFNLLIKDIKDVKFPKENNYNILMFPKSISEFDDDSFNSFLNNLSESKFSQNKLYLISSVMNKGFRFDSIRYEKVVDFLKRIGFICNNYVPTQEIKKKMGLVMLDGQFDYPNFVKDYIINLSNSCETYKLTGENCYPDCQSNLDRWPILKTDYMSFQSNYFEREL